MLTGKRGRRGFTLIELLVVLAIVGLLASLAVPSFFSSMQRSKESALKHDLVTLRKAIDDYKADNGKYPEELQLLADKKYIRYVPKDPFTERQDSWILSYDDKDGGISDVASGAEGSSSGGETYREW